MKLKLNIYNKRKVVKTYETEDYYITWGTMEDVMNSIDLTVFEDGGTNAELIAAVSKLLGAKDTVLIPILKDVFEGLTDDELRNARVTEMAQVFIGMVKFNLSQLSLFEDEEKN